MPVDCMAFLAGFSGQGGRSPDQAEEYPRKNFFKFPSRPLDDCLAGDRTIAYITL